MRVPGPAPHFVQLLCSSLPLAWHCRPRNLQGVSKGGMVEAILTAAAKTGTAPEFVLCIGDDRSDEDMFTAMEHVTFSPHLPAEVSEQEKM